MSHTETFIMSQWTMKNLLIVTIKWKTFEIQSSFLIVISCFGFDYANQIERVKLNRAGNQSDKCNLALV